MDTSQPDIADDARSIGIEIDRSLHQALDVLEENILNDPGGLGAPAVEGRRCDRLARSPEALRRLAAFQLKPPEGHIGEAPPITREQTECSIAVGNLAVLEQDVCHIGETLGAKLQCTAFADNLAAGNADLRAFADRHAIAPRLVFRTTPSSAVSMTQSMIETR